MPAPFRLPHRARLYLAVSLLSAAFAHAQMPVAVDVPADSLERALNALARQSGVQILFASDIAAGKRASALKGSYTPREALDRLLQGSGLGVQARDANTFTVVPADAAVLAPVKVSATADVVTEGSGSYTSSRMTIGKTEQTLREIPQSVSVVTRQFIDDQNLATLGELAAQSTGLMPASAGPGGGGINARGFLVDTLQFDGVAHTGFTQAFGSPDLAPYERIEILRGSAGLLQGSGNPSAAINLVRKRAARELSASVTAKTGSWDYYRTEVDVGGPLNESGDLRARAVAAYEDRDYFIDIAQSRNKVLYGVLDYDFTEATTLAVGWQKQERDGVPLIFGVPRYSNGEAAPFSRSTYYGPVWNDWTVELMQLFALLEHRWSNDWTAKLSLEREWESPYYVKRSQAQAIDVVTNSTRLRVGGWDGDTDRDGMDASVSGPFALAGRGHTLLAGVSFRNRREAYDNTASQFIAIADAFDFDPRDIPAPDLPYISHSVTEVEQYGVYGSGRFSLSDPLTLIVGGRLDWFDVLATNRDFAAGMTTTNADYSLSAEFAPYVGLVWDFSKRWSAYASHASIFQPQTSQFSASGSPLDPIEGNTYELGVKGEFKEGKLNTSFALFRIEQQNRAQEDLNNPCPGVPVSSWCYVAAGEVRSEGFEAEISGELLPDWQVLAGYTYNTTEYIRDRVNEGQTFSSTTPRHLLRLWSSYRLPGDWRRLTVGGGIAAQSGIYARTATAWADQGGYTLVNARIAYHLNDNFSIALNGNNLFDKNYFAGLATANSVYGDPRNFMLTLNAKF